MSDDSMKDAFYIQPLAGFILVQPLKETQIGSMIVSDQMNSKDSAGTVVAVGPSYTYYEGGNQISVACPVKIGDKIIYSNIGTNKYMDFKSGERLDIVRFHVEPFYSQILAIINE